MKYVIDLQNIEKKKIFKLSDSFSAENEKEKISFTNYYMCKDQKPFFGISGEFHFSRMEPEYWEDEILKMKACGINIISTYVFWIHHEEEEGIFDFTGRRNLRRFVMLCKKHGLYVILRIGPFDHGEVRNGGLPDWLYGKPFEVRKLNAGFLYYTKRLYNRLATEVKGLFFADNGPIIGVQIDNEYMHSSAPWEMTNGVSNEWVFGGDEGEAYMLTLKELAADCKITPVFYTCTGWGGAITPDCMMPLWGGYAYRPWLFYEKREGHPCTEEYIYQDFHNNAVIATNDFKPSYQPEDKPYACCEMGGGMMCNYNYRFILPYKSVDAMANIKLASGCNFLGYYVFQGGSNPIGKKGTYMNEGQVAKITYDYQAPIGEFGQIRESYQRLKTMHYFIHTFEDRICGLKTVLPKGASDIAPEDLETLRYAVRTDGYRGFLFINNFQDHANMPMRQNEEITLSMHEEDICFTDISIAGDENCILPFHFDMHGIDLVQAAAQPVTYLEMDGDITYLFMRPSGMSAKFIFEKGAHINSKSTSVYEMNDAQEWAYFSVEKESKKIHILCVDREIANNLYVWENKGFLFSKGALLFDSHGIRLETTEAENTIFTYPNHLLLKSKFVEREPLQDILGGKLGCYRADCQRVKIPTELKQVGNNRYTITFPKGFLRGIKDAWLQIQYKGDIGHAFIDGKMIHDHFCNGAAWEIGLFAFADALENQPMTIYITPKKESAVVNVESAMAARFEVVSDAIGEISHIDVLPVYEIRIL
ncbi:MAG: beta-galactosidase [Lachnospiraceae bacterium]|nr:beta-galactosidase [Lachnospiraceae bacterium]